MITAKSCTAKEIGQIIYDDEIYNRISDDNCPSKEQFIIPDRGCTYIAGFINNEIASAFIVHEEKMHFMVLKKYRKYARLLLDKSFKIYPHNVYVEIPTCYREVINFAKKYGFKNKEIRKNSHLKGGKWFDTEILTFEVL